MKHVLFVQNGDFRQAFERFADGEQETYRDQRRSVDFVAGLAAENKATIIAFGRDAYDAKLAPGLRAIGCSRHAERDQVQGLLGEIAPTHVVLRTPHFRFLREVKRRKLPVLPIFADIFHRHDLATRLKYIAFRHVLLRCKAPCVSNHSLNASKSLVTDLGVPPEQVVPWDWSHVPIAGVAKAGVADPQNPTAFFAGVLSEDKGVDDCLQAVASANRAGMKISMRFAGPGAVEPWQNRANSLGLETQITFLGLLPNAQVRAEMANADFVVVPSRHSYSEGLPNTIYEGLASRSVLVISDHPAFSGRLRADTDALVFPAAQPEALAQTLKRATEDRALYARLSENAKNAHDSLYVGMEWTHIVQTFLDDPENQTGWVQANALRS